MFDEGRIREALERGVRARKGLGPMRFIFELSEQPRSNLLLLGRRELRDFREGLFEECSHYVTDGDSTLPEPPNDIEFSGERKRVRCNEGLGCSYLLNSSDEATT